MKMLSEGQPASVKKPRAKTIASSAPQKVRVAAPAHAKSRHFERRAPRRRHTITTVKVPSGTVRTTGTTHGGTAKVNHSKPSSRIAKPTAAARSGWKPSAD